MGTADMFHRSLGFRPRICGENRLQRQRREPHPVAFRRSWRAMATVGYGMKWKSAGRMEAGVWPELPFSRWRISENLKNGDRSVPSS